MPTSTTKSKKANSRKRGGNETPTTTRRRRFARDHEERAPRRSAEEPAHHQAEDVTTDSLQLFFNPARKHPLLTAAEAAELAQRIEKGDVEAKGRMINPNLRLTGSGARQQPRHPAPAGDLRPGGGR